MLILVFALQATTSTCIDYGAGMIRCRSVGEASAAGSVYPYQPGIMQSAVKPGKREKRAGEYILQGDCKGAEDYALREGDFILASTVRSYCGIKALQRTSPK